MALKEFLRDCLDQNYNSLVKSLDGLTPEELSWRPDPQCMSIGFMAWHSARAQDFLVQTVAKGSAQLWEQGWADRFGRSPANPQDLGFGFKAEQLEAFQVPDGSLLLEYFEATRSNALEYLDSLDDDSLRARTATGPMGGSLTVAGVFQQALWELNQHGGQIGYVRGIQRGLEDRRFTGGVFEAARDAG